MCCVLFHLRLKKALENSCISLVVGVAVLKVLRYGCCLVSFCNFVLAFGSIFSVFFCSRCFALFSYVLALEFLGCSSLRVRRCLYFILFFGTGVGKNLGLFFGVFC